MPADTNHKEREYVVDRLRGFALLGVLLVNAPFLLTSVDGLSDASMPGWPDRVAGFLTWTLFQAKSYVIFSFLFGYSLAILLDSVRRKGLDSQRIYRQRLVGLFLFGCAHAWLLFVGDILVLYALLGSALLWLRHRPDRFLLRLAAVLFGLQGLLFASLALMPIASVSTPPWINYSWAHDGLAAATWTRLQVWPVALLFVLSMQGLMVVSLFCVGLVAGRRRWLADVTVHRPLLVRIRRLGIALGLPLQAVAGLAGTWPGSSTNQGLLLAALAVQYITAPILSAGYVAAIALLPRRGLARWVEADGRMSLSIYLGESLLMTLIAAGWGFGYFGLATGPTAAVAVAVWLLLLAAANLWHRHLGTGPAERLLRRITYAGNATPSAPFATPG